MDSPGHLQRHLDANGAREVVYCHACSNEWYRDDHGLHCPDCQSDVTEIISLDNDPRAFDADSASTSPDLLHHDMPFGVHNNDHNHNHHHDPHDHGHDLDSDPDEADIEEHLGHRGYHIRHSVRGFGEFPHHDPGVDPVFERFIGMINEFAPQRQGGLPPMFAHGREEGRFTAPHVHRATFSNGSASVTIFSGPPPARLFAPRSPNDHVADPFQALFSSVLRDVAPQPGRDPNDPNPTFARGLHDLLNLFNPAHAVSGDAVYSQEALDQIITNLMEAHPQSNAAPPASNEALRSLDRRPVEASMLDADGKTECTICIDDMNVGDLAAFLPCKHWFHEECVVLWLKEHNTCPVCRASIEKSGENNASNNDANGHANAPEAGAPGPSQPEDASGSGLHRSGPLPIPGARSPFARPPGPGQGRRDDPMRSPSFRQQERERERHRLWGVPSNWEERRMEREREREQERERERDRIWGVPSSPMDYDNAMPRRGSRNSMSPTSPRMTSFADYRVRQGQRQNSQRQPSPPQNGQRQGSPPQGSRRDGGSTDAARPPLSGPFSWLRERFSGGGSRDDANRDER